MYNLDNDDENKDLDLFAKPEADTNDRQDTAVEESADIKKEESTTHVDTDTTNDNVSPFTREQTTTSLDEQAQSIVDEVLADFNKTEEVVEVTPEPTVTTVPEPVFEEEVNSVVEETPEPVLEEEVNSVVEEAPEPVFEETPEPTFEETPEPVFEGTPEPTFEETPEPQEIHAVQESLDLAQTSEVVESHEAVQTPEFAEEPTVEETPSPFAKTEEPTVEETPSPFEKPEAPIGKKNKKAKKEKKKGKLKSKIAAFKSKKDRGEIDWKSIFMFWKKDDHGLMLKDVKERKATTDRVITLTLISIILIALSMLTLGFMLAYTTASIPEFLESTFARAFNWVTVVGLLIVPLFLVYFLYDLYVTAKGKNFQNYSKNEMKRIFIAVGLSIASYTIIFGSLMGTVAWILEWKDGYDEISALGFIGYFSATLMWAILSISLFIGLLVIWLVRYSKLNKTAIFAGSFDPIHDGHVNIIEKATKLFDRVHVVVATNSLKESKPLDSRYNDVKTRLLDTKRVKVDKLEAGLLADYAMEKDIHFLVRSVRNDFDFEYELKMAESNKMRYEELETILIMPDEKFKNLSSTSIRNNQTETTQGSSTSDNPFRAEKGEVKLVEKEDAENNWFSEKLG